MARCSDLVLIFLGGNLSRIDHFCTRSPRAVSRPEIATAKDYYEERPGMEGLPSAGSGVVQANLARRD